MRIINEYSVILSIALVGAACSSKSDVPTVDPNGDSNISASAQSSETSSSTESSVAEAGPTEQSIQNGPEGNVAKADSSAFELAMHASQKGSSPSVGETAPYGCSVKYAEGAEPSGTVAQTQKLAPDFSLNDLEGNPVSLQQYRGKTVVLEWFNPGCPFVVYAHEQGPLRDMAEKAQQDGVIWLAINSGAPGRQGNGAEENLAAVKKWKMSHRVLLDPSGEVGRKYGAKTTPQMFVIDPNGMLIYRGALDDAPMGRKAN